MSNKMNLIIKPRQSGRTTELINRCASYRYALIVCPTREQAEYVFKMAIDSKMDIPMPITFKEFVDGRFYAPNINAFLFDDLDGCLEVYSHGVKIDSVVFEEGRVDIENLPSAQPESTMGQLNENGQSTKDCISRQGAIRLITGYNGVVDKSVAKRLIAQMPSAQPEYSKLAIDAEALMDAFYKTPQDIRTWSRAWALINRAKLVQPERKKGKWDTALRDDPLIKTCDCICSICGGRTFGTPDFCPNCGADMRGDNNDE